MKRYSWKNKKEYVIIVSQIYIDFCFLSLIKQELTVFLYRKHNVGGGGGIFFFNFFYDERDARKVNFVEDIDN